MTWPTFPEWFVFAAGDVAQWLTTWLIQSTVLIALGLLIGLYMLPGIVIALPGGMLGQRFGAKRVVLVGLALMTIGGALMGDTLVVGLAEMGVPGHTGFALFDADGDQTMVTILFGHGLSPVSASGGMADHAMHEMDEMSGMTDLATPVP